jgi:regulator of sigma E protease
MSWVLTFLGFASLVILHEAGHFTAAKMVGMRVERFSLFFPPLLARVRRGETEYAIGAIPLGGYVKITGMNPAEEIPPEVAHRAYYRQPVWKRVFVIAAGPAVNIALAFLILAGIFLAQGSFGALKVGHVDAGTPAAKVLKQGDQVIGVDGHAITTSSANDASLQISKAIDAHHGTPVAIQIRRDGAEQTVQGATYYDGAKGVKRWRFGFSYDENVANYPAGPLKASGLAGSVMWDVTSQTVTKIAKIFKPEDRKQLSGIVGGAEATRQAFSLNTATALYVLALISLSLGIVNLFPFLPLDGGHIFWALAEKVRGRAIPFGVMERAGFVGFALVIALFVIGFTNDIGHIANGDFQR